jgi:hypothetical protein
MLFDHFADAITASINSTLMQRIFCAGQGPYALLACIISSMPFYFITMEQYYVGEMNLPMINGVDEGSVVIMIACCFTGLQEDNHKFWTEEIWVPGLNIY